MTDTAAVAAFQDETAARAAVLRDKLIDETKVCFIDLPICGETRRLRLDVNAWCDVETDAAVSVGPMAVYRHLIDGRATPALIRAIITHALKGGAAEPDYKPGPLVDRLLSDYPFGVAVGVAEMAVAAWLVGVDAPKVA